MVAGVLGARVAGGGDPAAAGDTGPVRGATGGAGAGLIAAGGGGGAGGGTAGGGGAVSTA